MCQVRPLMSYHMSVVMYIKFSPTYSMNQLSCTSYHLQAIIYQLSIMRYQYLVVSYRLLISSIQLSAIKHQLPDIKRQLSVSVCSCCRISVVTYPITIISHQYQPPTISQLLLIIGVIKYLPNTIYNLPFMHHRTHAIYILSLIHI